MAMSKKRKKKIAEQRSRAANDKREKPKANMSKKKGKKNKKGR